MIFSVWNQPARRYDYYRHPRLEGEPEANVPKPRHLTHDPRGVSPERAGWPLPRGAKKVGSGDYPVGRVAALGGVDMSPNTMILLGLGIAALVMWRKL